MNKKKIFILVIKIVFLNIFLLSCKEEKGIENKEIPTQYASIVGIAAKKENAYIYELQEKNMKKIGESKLFSDFMYHLEQNIYVFLMTYGQGTTLPKNKIEIQKNGKSIILDKFYYALDVKLSPEGGKIAYRSFAKDSLDSVENVKFYDIIDEKFIDFRTEKIISGDVYQWLNEDEFLYYGGLPEVRNSSKIYKYSLKRNEEKIYMENIKGFCIYFIPIENKGILFLERDNTENRLYYFDVKLNQKFLISKDIEEIAKAVVNKGKNEIDFVGNGKIENAEALYKVDMRDYVLSRLTYDFPKRADKNGGLSTDASGNVYFCGISIEPDKNDIYMFQQNEKSINLITSTPGEYKIYSGN